MGRKAQRKRLPSPSPTVLTKAEAAQLLRISESTVDRLIRRGHLHRLIGIRRILIARADVERFIAKANESS